MAPKISGSASSRGVVKNVSARADTAFAMAMAVSIPLQFRESSRGKPRGTMFPLRLPCSQSEICFSFCVGRMLRLRRRRFCQEKAARRRLLRPAAAPGYSALERLQRVGDLKLRGAVAAIDVVAELDHIVARRPGR